jgi:hypothetical protein
VSRAEAPPSDLSKGMRDHRGAGAEAETMVRYEAIHRHAELELELAGRGEIERLEKLGAQWAELTEGLPARPPAQALPLLERAKLIHERTRIELYRVRDRLVADLSTNTHAKRAAEGYGGRPARRPSLDRSA